MIATQFVSGRFTGFCKSPHIIYIGDVDLQSASSNRPLVFVFVACKRPFAIPDLSPRRMTTCQSGSAGASHSRNNARPFRGRRTRAGFKTGPGTTDAFVRLVLTGKGKRANVQNEIGRGSRTAASTVGQSTLRAVPATVPDRFLAGRRKTSGGRVLESGREPLRYFAFFHGIGVRILASHGLRHTACAYYNDSRTTRSINRASSGLLSCRLPALPRA